MITKKELSFESIKETILSIQKTLEEEYKVKSLGVFGSYTDSKRKVKNDLDILIELKEPIGLKYFELKNYLEEIFHIEIDLVVRDGLNKRMKDNILDETIYII